MRTSKIIFSLCFISMVGLANHVFAQCDTFFNADAVNSFLHTPQGMPTSSAAVDFVDIDGDGDLDCYVAGAALYMNLYKNIGNAKHPVYEYSAEGSFTAQYTPSSYFQFVDIDGDGDYDCFIRHPVDRVNKVSYLDLYENTGTAQKPSFGLRSSYNPAAFAVKAPYGSLMFRFEDVDKDGDMDFVYNRKDSSRMTLCLNKGTKYAAAFDTVNTIPVGYNIDWPCFYDWNQDGLPDAFIGGQYYQNKGTLTAPVWGTDGIADTGGPVFTYNTPLLFTDLNKDTSPEIFAFGGYMSSLTPIPLIDTSTEKAGGKKILKLQSHETSGSFTYSWAFNNKTLPGYHKPFIYAVKKGAYTLEITNACGTGLSIPYEVEQQHILAADEKVSVATGLKQDLKVSAYPNPFTSSVRVQVPSSVTINTVVKITDIQGKVLLAQTITGNTIQTGNSLGKGTYLLQVWQNGKLVYHDKLMKQ